MKVEDSTFTKYYLSVIK